MTRLYHPDFEHRDRAKPCFHFYPKAEQLEREFNRGELRLAAEVVLARELGLIVPLGAYRRAQHILEELAR